MKISLFEVRPEELGMLKTVFMAISVGPTLLISFKLTQGLKPGLALST